MATFTPEQIIAALDAEVVQTADIQRAKRLLADMGECRMSLGTWEPGHPKDWDEWAKFWADMQECILDGGAREILRGSLDSRFLFFIDRYIYGPIVMLPYRCKKLLRRVRKLV